MEEQTEPLEAQTEVHGKLEEALEEQAVDHGKPEEVLPAEALGRLEELEAVPEEELGKQEEVQAEQVDQEDQEALGKLEAQVALELLEELEAQEVLGKLEVLEVQEALAVLAELELLVDPEELGNQEDHREVLFLMEVTMVNRLDLGLDLLLALMARSNLLATLPTSLKLSRLITKCTTILQ